MADRCDEMPGGMAFPRTIDGYSGMSIRDYFAAKALPHALSRAYADNARYHNGDPMADLSPAAARNAYQIADAMLEARKR